MDKPTPFATLAGLTIVSMDSGIRTTWDEQTRATVLRPLKFPKTGDVEIRFHTACGRVFRMYHEQDCCESVVLEEIIGDLRDLLDTPIVVASMDEGEYKSDETGDDQWTFYTLRTHKGTVTLRWHGSSNGFYSTSVDFDEVIPDDAGTTS
jgi:hypothetical protein